MLFLLFGAVCWTVWLNRNDFVFKNKIILNPNGILYMLLSFMQWWTVLSSMEARDGLDKLIEVIKQHIPQDTAIGVG